jgi:hypothetical protein
MNQELQHSQLKPIHFLSYSSRLTLHACPKKLQIDKHGPEGLKESNVTFAFGHAVGAGIQAVLCGKTWEQVLLAMFFEWDVDLLARDEKPQKSFWEAVWAVEKFKVYGQVLSRDWEVAMFNGIPAVELSCKVDLQNGFYFRLYVDVVLQHKTSKQLLVVECKTTAANVVREETYKNSDQGLGYSIITDLIDNSHPSYNILYIVYQTKDREWLDFTFPKSRLDKAKWIKGIIHDCRQLQGFIDDNFFPMRGESCLEYFRPCRYYGMCEMSDLANLASPAALQRKVDAELEEKYMFEFTLEEIINKQLNLISPKGKSQ